MRVMRTLGLVTAMALAWGAGRAAAQPTDHAARGAQLFADGKLAEALVELEAAYRESGEPALLFALGRIHVARGDCVRAIDHFRRYLDTQPGTKGAEAAQAAIDQCEPGAAVEVTPPPPTEVAPTLVAPIVVRQAAPAPPSFAKAMIRDRLVQVGLVAGVLAAGTALYAARTACWGSACAVPYDDLVARRDRVRKLDLGAAVLGGVGGALIIAGAIRLAVRDRDEPRFEARLAPTRGGGAIVVAGRF